MNRSFTKQRKIQEANMLLENRFLIKEYKEERDKDSNRWYTYQNQKTKKWQIGLETFSPKQVKDPLTDPLFKGYSKYFVEYTTEPNAEAALTNLIADLKSGKKTETNVTTTTTKSPVTTQTTTASPKINPEINKTIDTRVLNTLGLN
jgi:hypothetical protein